MFFLASWLVLGGGEDSSKNGNRHLSNNLQSRCHTNTTAGIHMIAKRTISAYYYMHNLKVHVFFGAVTFLLVCFFEPVYTSSIFLWVQCWAVYDQYKSYGREQVAESYTRFKKKCG